MTSLLELVESWAASPRVLVLEDDQDVARVLEEMLSGFDCEVTTAHTLAEGLVAAQRRFDIVFVDLRLPDGSGVELIRHFKFHAPTTPIVVMTALTNDAMIDKALSCGVVALLRKPYDTTVAQVKNTFEMFKIKLRSRRRPAVLAGAPAVAVT